MGGLEPLAEGLGGVGGAEALDRIAEEGLPCRLRHDGLRGGLVGVGGDAGAHLLEGMHHVHRILPSRSPGPLRPAAELLQSGGRPPDEVGGGLGGGGSVPGVLERRGEDVDLWWWWAWRCLGERERRWRGLGVEDGYGQRVKREGEVDMGRGGALGGVRGSGSGGGGGWGWWMGMGGGGNGEPGGACGGRGRWTLGGGGVPRGARGEQERWWRGLGVGVLYGRRGGGEVDMGWRWRSWWRPGEAGAAGAGFLGGRGGTLGERERREWVVEARWRSGECGRRGQVCRAGSDRERRRLRDRASSLESGQSGGGGGSWGASRGAAWYWWGDGGSPVVHGSAT